MQKIAVPDSRRAIFLNHRPIFALVSLGVRAKMSTEEPKSEGSPSSGAKAETPPPPEAEAPGASASPPPDVDAAVAWPPPEAAPEGAAASPADSGVMTAPDATPAAKPAGAAAQSETGEIPAATPQEEMGLSNSTLHWLEDGDQAVPSRLTEPGTMPSYDPRAPVPGRRRAVLVVGVAGLAALVIAGALYTQAEKRRAAQAPAPVAVEPARDLTTRAETALAAHRFDEALELAHLALVADPRFADAHFVVGTVERGRLQNAAARDEFRKYLELAPLGTHAAEARTALASLPP